MKIAQIAPLYEAVPPSLYGGTERIVAHLTNALVELGHEVTLFASAEAHTRATLVPVSDQAIRLDSFPLKSDLAAHLSMLHELHLRRHEFDLLHFHVDLIHFPFFEDLAARTVPTLHGRLDLKDLPEVYSRWRHYPLVSVSDDQRQQKVRFSWKCQRSPVPDRLAGAVWLVLIEAMACGTPVIAWRCGSVTEIIENGKTGFIVDTEDEAVRAVLKLVALFRDRSTRAEA